MEGSKWDEVLQGLIESSLDYKKFTQEHLVNYCLENKITRGAAEEFLEKYKKSSGKDSALALQKKEEGNEKYKLKKFEESLSLYTESIFLAKKNDECLPLAYSNRSLVLQHMGCPSESLVDIDMALSCGYPKAKLDKLLLRKAKCLSQLGEVEKAKEILGQALQNSEEKGFHQLIENELKKMKSLQNKKNIDSENKLPELLGGINENFVSASKHLSVYYEKTKGRHVIATQDIEIGDVLFVEKPFAFIVFKNCFNCAKSLLAPLPCLDCMDVLYCSSKCRDEFWKSVHSFECGFGKLFKSVGIANLSLRIILKASYNLDGLKKILNNISEVEYENGPVICRSKEYDAVYNLVHHIEKYETSDLFQYIMFAEEIDDDQTSEESFASEQEDTQLPDDDSVCHLDTPNTSSEEEEIPATSQRTESDNYLAPNGLLWNKTPSQGDEDLKLLTSVINRHILQLICNGNALSDVLDERTSEKLVLNKMEVRTGTGIYVSASMMNHSCEPSIINSFYRDYLIVRAAKPIKKGEEVFNCYGLDARRKDRATRQEILSKQYFFKCKCQACLQTYDIQDKFTAFKCSNCKGPSIRRKENSISTVCLSCGQNSKMSTELAKKFNDFYYLIEEGEDLYNNDIILALKKFLKAWWIGREIFYKFHKDLNYAADEVAKCLLDLKDFRRCILFLKCCIRSVEERFGSFSIELAHEMKKLGDATLSYLIEEKKSLPRDLANQGVLYYQKAHRIMSLLYGPEYKVLKEIKLHREMLERLLKS